MKKEIINIDIKFILNPKKSVDIVINDVLKKEVSLSDKTINISDIYEMLEYKSNNKYNIKSDKYSEEETYGKANEDKRLYNYLIDLYYDIVKEINRLNDDERKTEKM